MAGINGFEPQEGSPVLMSRELFEEFLEMKAKYEGANIDVDYGGTVRGTVTYCEPTIYDLDSKPDPLTVGQDDGCAEYGCLLAILLNLALLVTAIAFAALLINNR